MWRSNGVMVVMLMGCEGGLVCCCVLVDLFLIGLNLLCVGLM